MSDLKLSQIQPGLIISGLEDDPVTIIHCDFDEHVATITYKDAHGSLEEILLFSEDLENLSIVLPTDSLPFTGDPDNFQLAAEALRIKTAGLHDPMSAVTSSEIQPLPHQIRAVYEEMLPRIPLHFLLADDPGAGKTIMTGLYLKELLLRGDVKRCLIVAPGGLAGQWQDELLEKFRLRFHILGSVDENTSSTQNPFKDHDLLIVRMDAVARSHDLLMPLLEESTWDLTVVDEAHRMSASKGFRKELHKTKRFILGESLRSISRHLLLLTATPHNGDNEAFQAFLSLLDPDRFEAAYQTSNTQVDTSGLMRRMVKEELLTFEGKPLFPERRAVTVPYMLTQPEMDLYESVTSYVREEMNRAEAALQGRESKAVGFALTVLQRRLASSPAAIYSSLKRRHDRLENLRVELLNSSRTEASLYFSSRGLTVLRSSPSTDLDELDLSAFEFEELEEESLLSPVTAARSLQELNAELLTLEHLVEQARTVVTSNEDRKWSELRHIITNEVLQNSHTGERRKLIIFTEHRDTLEYLCRQIRTAIGSHDAVVSIHGGVPRLERQRIRENFTHNNEVQFLVATDAAGEGLNLQAAYLMVNYDLPWNPNRIEQRFGRIHRIGQKHVCILWNLVADETREGAVYLRLLEKMETQRTALGTRVFDVLGDAFQEQSLRQLMMDAIRYIDDPARAEEINQIIDAEISKGTEDLLAERALVTDAFSNEDLQKMKLAMDEARARRLQPHYISQFFFSGFEKLQGRFVAKQGGTASIRRIPSEIHRWAKNNSKPLPDRYDLITFNPDSEQAEYMSEFIAPGHPLLDGLVDVILDKYREALDAGTVLIDDADPDTEPWLLVTSSTEIRDRTASVQAGEFSYTRVSRHGEISDAGHAPYLDFSALPADIDLSQVLEKISFEDWFGPQPNEYAKRLIATKLARPLLERTRQRVLPELDRTEKLVSDRLNDQQNYLAGEAIRAEEHQRRFEQGLENRPPSRSARSLKEETQTIRLRLETRLNELARQKRLTAAPPQIEMTALVIPSGLLNLLRGADSETVAMHAKDTTEVERRAVEAALAAERSLGRVPTEMARNNPGYDIISSSPDPSDPNLIIEVKGRISGSDYFYITHTEVQTGRNAGKDHRLVLVDVSPNGPDHDQIRYVSNFCDYVPESSYFHKAHVLDWEKIWQLGTAPI